MKKEYSMNKNDIRYLKTEEKLKTAYLTLLSQQTQKTITVIDICKIAHCSRNTFYLHYETREDLEKQLMHDILENLAFAFFPQERDINQFETLDNHIYTDAIIDSIVKNQEAITVLLQNDTGAFTKALSDTIYQQCLESINSYFDKNLPENIRLYIRYLAHSITGFIYEWLANTKITNSEAKKLLYLIHDQTITTINHQLSSMILDN